MGFKRSTHLLLSFALAALVTLTATLASSQAHAVGLVQTRIALKLKKARAKQFAGLRPGWLSSYQVTGRGALYRQPNLTYLSNKFGERRLSSSNDPFTEQLENLFDPGQAAGWRKQYENMNEAYEQRRRAGLSSPTHEASYQGSIQGFRDTIQQETKKYKLHQSEVIANGVVRKNPTTRPLLYPGVIVAGLYIGKPVSLRLAEESRLSLRTSIRDRFGQLEFHSSILYGSFEFHPDASDRYTLWGNPGVDFGKAMNFDHVVDFEGERYQFKVARSVPFVDLNSFVLYGSSSNTLTGSVSKQLTSSVSAVVDSIYYLTPYAADHSMEERVRLKYSVNF